MPLSGIKDVLDRLPRDAAPIPEFWIAVSGYWTNEVNERIAQMERMRDRFTECIGCGCLSFDQCQLVNPGDALAEKGPGAHRLLDP